MNALTVQWGDLTKALHENAEFTALYLRGVHSFHDLDAVSKLRFSAFQNRFFKNFEGMYYSRREGILTSELWDEIERTMSDFLAYDGVRQWWETRKHWHTEAFVAVVDAMIARGDKPTAYSTYDLKQVVLPTDKLMSEIREWPRIAVVGAGAVGGYFGGMFARAGAPIVFVGRKHFADAVNSKGLVLDKSEGRGANHDQGDG